MILYTMCALFTCLFLLLCSVPRRVLRAHTVFVAAIVILGVLEIGKKEWMLGSWVRGVDRIFTSCPLCGYA